MAALVLGARVRVRLLLGVRHHRPGDQEPGGRAVRRRLSPVPAGVRQLGVRAGADMPDWLQAFASVQPVSVTVNAVRALSEGGPTLQWFWQSLAWTAGILLVFVPCPCANTGVSDTFREAGALWGDSA